MCTGENLVQKNVGRKTLEGKHCRKGVRWLPERHNLLIGVTGSFAVSTVIVLSL